jgi:PAS domain S-box-containing protein
VAQRDTDARRFCPRARHKVRVLAEEEPVRWWQSHRTVPLSWYLVAIISVATLPLAAFAAYLVLSQSQAAQTLLERNLRSAASAIALTVERDLATSTEVLRTFGESDAMRQGDRQAIEREMTRLLARRADWIGAFLLDANGAIVLARGDERALRMSNSRPLREQLADPLGSPGAVRLLRQRVGDEEVSTVAMPVASTGPTRWTLAVMFQPEKWQLLLDHQAPGIEGFAGIVDGDMRWIARVARTDRNVPLPSARLLSAIPSPLTAQGMQRVVTTDDDKPVYLAWSAIGATGWRAAVGLPANPVDLQQSNSIAAALLGGVAAFLIGLASSLVVSRGVTSPLARLAQGMGPQRTGGKRPTVAEIEKLTRALELAEAQRDADRAALQAKADEFETLFRRTPVGLAVAADRECRHVIGNAALLQLLGLQADANLSLTPGGGEAPAALRFRARDGALAAQDLPLQRAAQHGEETQGVEYSVERGDGHTVQLLGYAAPLRASDGSTRGAVGAFIDITERTRKDLRLRETQARLEASEQRLELAQEVGRVGFFEYDFVGDCSVWTSGMGKLFGIDPAGFVGTWAAWTELVEADDAVKLRADVDAALGAHAPTVAYEYRARHRDGSNRVLAGRALLLYTADGTPQRMVGVAVDVTEQSLTERERAMFLAREQQARQEAEMANRTKDEFLAMFSHELRNPLSAIASAAEVLNRLGGQQPDEVRARDVIRRQIHHLTRMIEDLLDVTRVVNGKITLSRAPLDLAAAVQRCVSGLNVMGRLRDHRLELDLAPVWIQADSMRIDQITSNLLTNAIKYTPAGGTITIKVAADGESALLAVSDTGVGIHADMIDRVFELFVQVDRASTRRHGGLGVGLTLVRRLAEIHDGCVIAASDGADRGSRFEVRLPRIAAPAPG